MRIDIITCLPGLLEGPFSHSILKRAHDRGLAEIFVHDLREYATNKHRQVDDYQYGGGAGMVLMVEPIARCIEHLSAERPYDDVVLLTPDGVPFVQKTANELALKQHIILLSGHYKGVDDRVRQHLVTREISIGDYVLSGGELAAAVITDAVVRLIPGVLSDESSALSDSFQDGLLGPPVYTRPADYRGWKVPEVLLSGHTAHIESWRHEESVRRTMERRPDLLGDDKAATED
jgi:tRNA (guanine37-N1)-methyltransferase